ncbi:hypothetical protein [uncultured Sphingomonas sp.]|uniref:hypothetical protein n=1 Tax=uncultured Sphingomonas sp. TaxID=158754 RepID=UPI0025F968A1|nr:hypothetical protein [uncultured Sphingomonas sp.]
MSRVLAWVDGANSAVMAKLALSSDPDIIPVHVDLGTSVDEDSHRFIDDLEGWFGKEIVRIRSDEFANVDEVFEKRKYLGGQHGAPCTGEMKVAPRLIFQRHDDTHLWGYTADRRDARRFRLMQENYPELRQDAPLIARGITKLACHALLERSGIRRPRVYDLGFPNGNCLGCSKSSSPGYWAAVRLHFPEVWARRVDQDRRFGRNKLELHGRRVCLDQLPADFPPRPADIASCDFLCHLAEQDIDERVASTAS